MQIAAAITKAVFTILVKVGVPKAIAAGVATWGVKIALSVALSSVMRAMQPKPRGMDQGTELQTKLDPAYPREVAVGQFATGGSLAYINSEGTNNANLWMVIALSDDKIEQITQIRGSGAALTFSGDIHTGLRACTSHFQTSSGGDCLYVRIYKGDESQTADADLIAAFPSDLDSNFRGRGVAYAIVKMIWDPDAFANGTPELIFVGEGAHCLDPRTDTTAYTSNAALIAGQFLRGFTNNGIRVVGLGCSADDLPETELGDAADDCDDAISLAAGGTEARYRAGGMISARETPREVLSHLMAAMAGEHIDRGGEIVLLPGVARTPTLDIAEPDLLADEGIAFAARRTADERINAITSTFVNPADGWQEASLPPRKDASAITADGDRFETSRAYRFVFSKTQGQRLDEIVLRSARKEGFLSVPAPLWAFELAPGDWVTMTNQRWGGGAKTWKVESVNLAIAGGAVGGNPSARCSLTLRETASSVYAWTTGDEITLASGSITAPTLPALTVSGYSATALSVTVGSVIMPELAFEWDAVAPSLADTIEIEYRREAEPSIVYTFTADAAAGVGQTRNGLYPDVEYETRVRLRAAGRDGAWSAWASAGTTPEDMQVGSGAGAALSVALSDAFEQLIDTFSGDYTSASIVATVTGNVGAVTYQWTQLAGDTGTINAPTAGTSTFTFNLPSPGSKEALFQLTAIDGANGRSAAAVFLFYAEYSL